ncbi:MAG: TetR/AcrR family transcriptional regulator [Clostridia bacterium]|nr:TetR/AcrR family transcriptional regulator [Clostridia bacterium]
MAPKTKITKEMIVDSAIEITRKEGIDAVNARRIGAELGCSLQPVYYQFGTMDALREAVIARAKEIYNAYINESKKAEEKRFKVVGEQYVLFAIREKQLFRLLFMRNANHRLHEMEIIDENTDYILSELQERYSLTLDQAKKIHFETWVATHGIASMIATDYMTFTPDQISELLSDFFVGLLMKHTWEEK